MKRRTFIETSIAAAAVYAARPSWAAETTHEIKRVGLQLYTVRSEMPKDFEGTIAKVAADGLQRGGIRGVFRSLAERCARDRRQERADRAFDAPRLRPDRK